MMESRVLLAFLLSFVILIGWQFIFPSPPPTQITSVTQQAVPEQTPQSPTSPAKSTGVALSTTIAPTPGRSETLTLENEDVAITFTNMGGGGISSVRLKKFYESIKRQDPYRLFEVSDSGPLFRIMEKESSCFKTAPRLHKPDESTAQLTYVCDGDHAFRVKYRLHKRYFLKVLMEADGIERFLGKEIYASFPANAATRSQTSSYNAEQIVYAHLDEIDRVNLTGKETEAVLLKNTPLDWMSFGDRYFFIGLLAHKTLRPVATARSIAESSSGQPIVSSAATHQLITLQFLLPKQIDDMFVFGFEGYLGPKDKSLLANFGTMDKVIDFGFFRIIAVPIWYFLVFFYEYLISNFGIAIIVLTALVRLLFLPLTLKGMGNMQAMQKIQPQIQKLREKHKEDKQKLNQEMVLLLRAHKVNPLGGCLPILIQIPVFIALYAVLGNAVELYQAPFMLWIQDLSSKDPFYVLPVLLGLSFFVQQKLTPSTVDPNTQKIMMIMPLMFTVFMINLPSGLNLYIFTSTVLGIIQQWVTNKKAKVTT